MKLDTKMSDRERSGSDDKEKVVIPGLGFDDCATSSDFFKERRGFLFEDDHSRDRDDKTSRSSSRSGKYYNEEDEKSRDRHSRHSDDRGSERLERSERGSERLDRGDRSSDRDRGRERERERGHSYRHDDRRSRGENYSSERSRERERPSRYDDDRSRERSRPTRFDADPKPSEPRRAAPSDPESSEEPSTSALGPDGRPIAFKRKQDDKNPAVPFKKKLKKGVKGLRVITPKEILYTRPADNVKQGVDKDFKSIMLQTNYFNIIKKPDFDMVQYRVDFYPHVDLLNQKKGYLKEHAETLGGYIFDGTCAFLARKLDITPTELMCKNREGKPVKISLKEVAIISMTNQTSIQLLNLILRKAMEGLKLQQVGRNYFDAAAKVSFRFQF
jgi:hypothetical protein